MLASTVPESESHFGMKCLVTARPSNVGPNRYLFLCRSKNGNWDIPGGRMDGDNPWDGLAREVSQETGHELVMNGPDAPFPAYVQEVPPPPKTPFVLRVTWLGRFAVPGLITPTLSDEHTDFDWLTLYEAQARLDTLDPATRTCIGSLPVRLLDEQTVPELSLAQIRSNWQAALAA